MKLTITDSDRCIGCQCCMFACARRQASTGLSKACIEVRSVGGMERGFIIIVCRDCDNHPCTLVCPTNAIKTSKNPGVVIDMTKCNGCGHCTKACIIGAIFWDAEVNKPMICNHCGYCVRYCPHGVLKIVKHPEFSNNVV